MADAVQAGLTRAVGVSNYKVDQMCQAHDALAKYGIPLASNQVQYSLLHRHPERNGLLRACDDLGVTLIAYSPLAQGLLSDKYGPDNPPPGLRGRRFGRARLAEIQPLVALLGQFGQAHGGKTPAQVALNWTMCKGSVPIPGAKNASQARENAGALGWRMSHDEVAALDAASDRIAGKTPPTA
jgi:aryl-alcohol dehydrogenase-like predicted oxidoreductase